MNTSLFKHIPAITIGVIVGMLLLSLRSCFIDGKKPLSFTLPLANDTVAQIALENHHIAIRTHTDTQAAYVPSDGHVSATVSHAGDIVLTTQTKGFTFDPVLGMMLTDKLRIAGGAQIGFWNRYELYLGGGFPKPTAFVGLGYRLDQIRFLQNTSIAVVYTSSKEIGAAVFLRF